MDQALYKKLKFLFEPVDSPDKLDEWLRYFTGVEFPWDTVDPESTSAPLKALWGVYQAMLYGKDPKTHVVAASRNSLKTLQASAVHLFSMVQFRRDSAHIAATLNQSYAAASYLNQFINRTPELIQFRTMNNFRKIEFENLPVTDFTDKITAKIQIVTATKKGTNAPRASCFAGHTMVSLWNPQDHHVFQHDSIENIFRRMLNGEHIQVASVNPITYDIEPRPIQGAMRSERLDRVVIHTNLGDRIECTPDHPIGVKCSDNSIQYVNAGLLTPGSPILQEYGNQVVNSTVSKVEPKDLSPHDEDTWVYDIQVQDNHNFFANQILAHNCLIFDEVDLTDPAILSEASLIQDPTRDKNRFDPVFMYLSSRKTNSGPLQGLIDEAVKPGQSEIRLHKWSAVDMMQTCPIEIRKTEEFVDTGYINTENLQVIIGEQNFDNAVSAGNKTVWRETGLYEGCKTCPAFIACQGHSSKQRGESPSLRSISFTASFLKRAGNPNVIISQILNYKPDPGGIVFRTFAQHRHLLDPMDFYEYITRKPYNPTDLTIEEFNAKVESAELHQILQIMPDKLALYKAMIDHGWNVNFGVDWGYSPDPANCIVVGWHPKWKQTCILHYEEASELADHIWAKDVEDRIASVMPPNIICPDMANKSCPTFFKKNAVWSQSKERIEVGVSFIRGLLWDPLQQKTNFAILDDSLWCKDKNNLKVVDSMEHWSHYKKPTGEFDFDKFADGDYTHALDAMRYALHPHFKEGKISAIAGQPVNYALTAKNALSQTEIDAIKERNKLQNHMREFLINEAGVDIELNKPKTDKPANRGPVKFKF